MSGVTEIDPAVVARLRAAGCVFAEDEARLMTEAATTPADLEDLVRRRVAGEPLEPLLGWAEFDGLRILMDPGVFVPRRRTEFLVERAVAIAHPDAVVVDLCCGAAAIGVAIAAGLGSGATLVAADVDPAAVRCARRNVQPAGRVFEGDLYEALPAELRGRVDILAVNAPYVPTDEIALMPPEARLYEPGVALDGGKDGLEVHRRVAAGASEWLVPGGSLLIETSARQADRTARLFTAAGLDARIERSEDRDATVVIATAVAAAEPHPTTGAFRKA